MSTLHSMKKSINKNTLKFPMEMYTSMPGSVVITGYILATEKPTVASIKKLWKKYSKTGFGFDFSDPDYITKTLSLFNLPMFDLNYVAFVQSDFNALIAPYIDGEIMPLREDGRLAATLRKGKIYPLKGEYNDTESNK